MEVSNKADSIRWWDALDAIVYNRCTLVSVVKSLHGCNHADARWFVSLFPAVEEDVTREKLLAVMAAQGEDPRALYIRGRLGVGEPGALVQQAAELGYGPAQGKLAGACEGPRLSWAQKAAAQGDRRGLFWLGHLLWHGEGCEPDRARAIACYTEAAELGDRDAQWECGGKGWTSSDWQRYRWWGLVAAQGDEEATVSMLDAATEHLRLFDNGSNSGRVVFELGAAFKGHVDVPFQCVFGSHALPDLQEALRCIELHDKGIALAKAAIETWIAVGRRQKVAKDMRTKIARLLWAERADWLRH